MSEAFDAVVVGAGYGGATTAALLTRAGWRVALVDQNRMAGGKALSIDRAGTRYEMWPVAGGPAVASRFAELLRLIGADEGMLLCPPAVCEFVHLGAHGQRKSFVVPAGPVHDPRELARMLKRLGVPTSRLAGMVALSLFTLAIPDRALDRLDRVSALDLLRWFRLPGPLSSFMAALFNVLFVVPVDRLPASEALRTLRDFSRGGAGRYHAGGYGAVAERAARYVEEQGGAYLSSTRVERIRVGGPRVTGVRTASGQELTAPVVVSNAGIQPTVLRLVGAEHFAPGYLQRIRQLEPSWALVGVRYQLDAEVFTHPMTLVFSDENWLDAGRFRRAECGEWPAEPLVFVTVPALWDPGLVSGSVRQVALLGTLSSPDPESPMTQRAIERLEAAVRHLWPGLEGHILQRQAYGPEQVSRLSRDAVLPGQGGECIGLGQLIGQCGRSKPSSRSPIEGLYYVGCDAGGYGCGTHQAVESGFRVAEQVLKDRQRLRAGRGRAAAGR